MIGVPAAPALYVSMGARETFSNVSPRGHKPSLTGTLRTVVSGLMMGVMLLVAVPTLAAIAGPTLKLNIVQPVDASCYLLGVNYSAPAYTKSTDIVINYSGFSCGSSSTFNFNYVYALMSRTDSTFNTGAYSKWTYIGTEGNVQAGGGAFAMDLTAGGNVGVSQGSNTYYLDITMCTAQVASGSWQTHAYANLGGSGTTCTKVSNPGPVTESVVYDNVAPSVWGSTAASTNSRTIVLNFGASDATSLVNNTSGYVYNGGWQSCGTLGGTSGTFYCGVPSDGNWVVGLDSRDNAGNDSEVAWQTNVCVDNAAPTGGWVSAGSAYTAITTTNLSFGANSGGCSPIDNLAISNDGVNWWYANGYITSFAGWNFTSGYGGNANQGSHTIYLAFHEAGSNGGPHQDGWSSYASTTINYNTVALSGSISLSVGASAYTNSTSITTYYSNSSKTAYWQLYRHSLTVDGAGNCTIPAVDWTQIVTGGGPVSDGAFSNTGLTNGTCYQWALNSWDSANNLNQVLT
jgi:hypothetical protein